MWSFGLYVLIDQTTAMENRGRVVGFVRRTLEKEQVARWFMDPLGRKNLHVLHLLAVVE